MTQGNHRIREKTTTVPTMFDFINSTTKQQSDKQDDSKLNKIALRKKLRWPSIAAD